MNQSDKKWVSEVWNKIENKMTVIAPNVKTPFPYTTKDGKYVQWQDGEEGYAWWTNGFWGGINWILYNKTKNEVFKEVAEKNEIALDEALADFECLHHDVGFMWILSSVANYKLTCNKKSKNRGLTVASTLAARYNDAGKFIRAWNNEGLTGWVIIDCMMNIPLLYWASTELDDPRFSYIAKNHANTTLKNHLRADGSVKHILSYDPVTGELIEDFGGQGYKLGSSWSRGQAWALYGYILSYIHTKDENYLNAAKRVAHYFISSVCNDWLPKCDFRCPDEPVIYDTTAGATAACGLIEIANAVPEYEKKIYLNAAISILKALEKNFANWETDTDNILINGTEAYNSDERGIHIPIIYGDYFFIEAIDKLNNPNNILLW